MKNLIILIMGIVIFFLAMAVSVQGTFCNDVTGITTIFCEDGQENFTDGLSIDGINGFETLLTAGGIDVQALNISNNFVFVSDIDTKKNSFNHTIDAQSGIFIWNYSYYADNSQKASVSMLRNITGTDLRNVIETAMTTRMNDDSSFFECYNGSDWSNLTSYIEDTWYNFSITIDTPNFEYNVSINGVDYGTCAFEYNQTNLFNMDIFPSSSTLTGNRLYYDNIIFYNDFADIVLNYPSNVSLDTGTLESGDVESVQADDTDYYNVSEIVGTPAFVINYTFLNFTGFNYIEINAQYDGNLTHVVDVDVYNGSEWITLGVIPDNEALITYEYAVADYTDYNISGQINLTINHTSAGNINHWLAIDWIRLIHRPVVTLHNTSGYANTTPVELNFTAVDLGNDTVSCTAYNGTDKIGINASVTQGIATILELNITADGNYSNVFINCTDNLDYNVSDSIWIYLDTIVSGLTAREHNILLSLEGLPAIIIMIIGGLLLILIYYVSEVYIKIGIFNWIIGVAFILYGLTLWLYMSYVGLVVCVFGIGIALKELL